MKKYVLSLVVLGSWFGDARGMMIIPVPHEGVSFGQSSVAFDGSFLNCTNKVAGIYDEQNWGCKSNSADFWSEEESFEGTSNDSENFANTSLSPYLEKRIAFGQKDLDAGSWNVSNDSDFWGGKSDEPVKYEETWNFPLLSSLNYFDNTKLQNESILHLDPVVNLFLRNNSVSNESVQDKGEDSVCTLIHSFSRAEVSSDENQAVTDLICKFKPEEKSIGNIIETKSKNLFQKGGSLIKKDECSQKMGPRMNGVDDDTVASMSASAFTVGSLLRKIVSRALARGASLIGLGSKIVFSAVSAPVIFTGLRFLGVGTFKSFTTAGAFAISPFVISPVHMVGKSVGLASRLGVGGYRLFRNARNLWASIH